MEAIKSILSRSGRLAPSRNTRRAELRAARNRDSEQYLAICSSYLDLVSTYYGCSYSETGEARRKRVTELFIRIWQQLKYTERLSDFEYLLTKLLTEDATPQEPTSSSDPIKELLRKLPPHARFALIAYEMEHWPVRWLALALRKNSKRIHTLLSETRCKLCRINWESLNGEARQCLLAISRMFDHQPNIRRSKAISKQSHSCPEVTQIKAEWLELRAKIVEIHLRYRISEKEREYILRSLLESVPEAFMQKPGMVDRLINSVHFIKHKSIQAS